MGDRRKKEGENGRGFEGETGERKRERMGEGLKGKPENGRGFEEETEKCKMVTGNANANLKHKFLIMGFP
jgi:hypothetical protein